MKETSLGLVKISVQASSQSHRVSSEPPFPSSSPARYQRCKKWGCKAIHHSENRPRGATRLSTPFLNLIKEATGSLLQSLRKSQTKRRVKSYFAPRKRIQEGLEFWILQHWILESRD